MIVGIDIGTSFSSICIVNKEGKAEPVKVSTGLAMYGSDYSLPSAVFLANGKPQLGQAAYNSRMKSPENFKSEFKRDFGQEIPYHLGGQQWMPEDLYKEVILHLKYCAETYAADAITMAYLTHPARFTEKQKKLLLQSAQRAGLLKVTLVEEPVAAAFHYVHENNLDDDKILLVYDFGGGTFDVALIRYYHGEFSLMAQPSGLDRCGGIDMDRLVYNHILGAVPAALQQTVKASPKMLQNFGAMVNEQSIKTKHHLSSSDNFQGELAIGFDFIEFGLNRSGFNQMIRPLVDETIQSTKNLLKSGGLSPAQVDVALLVGGSSRIPLIKSELEKLFPGKVKENINPELSVAMGAAAWGKSHDLSCGFTAYKDVTGRFGFRDSVGQNVLPAIYEEAKDFTENRAVVKMNGLWGVIDQTGKIICPFAYDELHPYNLGLARGRKGANWGFLNRTGAEHTEFKYRMLGEFTEGLCPVKSGGLCGYLSPDGDERIPMIYSHIEPFSDGKALVRRNNKLGYINTRGDEFIACFYDEIGTFINGNARVKRDNKAGYIHADGKEYIPCYFDEIGEFVDGIAIVKVDNRYGFIHEDGKAATRIMYHKVSPFYAGRSVVGIDRRNGVIDTNDNIVIPIHFQKIVFDRDNVQFIVGERKQTGIYSINGDALSPLVPQGGYYSDLVELVFVEGGTFKMGDKDNGPIHQVTLTDFYIGKYPVTQKQWQTIMGNNPSDFKGKNNPVEKVSWYDAVAFCNKLGEMEGLEPVYKIEGTSVTLKTGVQGYRLPTEAEWEYAARGGAESKGYEYAGSNNINDVAEYEGNNNKTTKPVGGKKPNELGLYDMSGNVWEWCHDWHGSYPNKPQTNPTGAASGSGRVRRGGGWRDGAQYCRVAYRTYDSPDYRCRNLGFRLVLVP